jgi:hypothetical protein
MGAEYFLCGRADMIKPRVFFFCNFFERAQNSKVRPKSVFTANISSYRNNLFFNNRDLMRLLRGTN